MNFKIFFTGALINALFSIQQNAFAGWGEKFPGIISNINPTENQKILYLTFDACGGKNGNNYDKKLIDFLTENKIPATLFINARWIDKNPEIFKTLSENKLFSIQNHGVKHRPASVSGKSVYGITGTNSIAELIAEIVPNSEKIKKITGIAPTWYRSGAAFYDIESVNFITDDLGLKIAGFSVSMDAGAILPAMSVAKNIISAKSGDIILGHMNHPESGTADGVITAIPKLLKSGWKFAQLPIFYIQNTK